MYVKDLKTETVNSAGYRIVGSDCYLIKQVERFFRNLVGNDSLSVTTIDEVKDISAISNPLLAYNYMGNSNVVFVKDINLKKDKQFSSKLVELLKQSFEPNYLVFFYAEGNLSNEVKKNLIPIDCNSPRKQDCIAYINEIFDNKMVDNKAIIDPRVSIKMVKVPNSNVYILYEKQGDSLFLYNLCKNEPDSEEIIAFLSNFDYDVEENAIVSRLKEDARRAYPSFILIDYDLWKDIENDGVGNLALSSEQVDIMRNPDYPIFINGQAGSGKSTILYYLFANILYNHKDNLYEPIFLTYNARLLETAKKCVKAILAKHPNYSDSNYPVDNIDKFFHPFQKFILEKMLDERGRVKFSKDKYISFNKFRRYYTTTGHKCSCKLNLNKNLYSPELVWYIIRSYIKGRSLDEFTIDDYNSLERGDKTVSPDIIDYVIKNIWQGWYKNLFEEEGYWDDQDLVQYALNTPIEFDR